MVETSQGIFAMGGTDWDGNKRNEVLKLECPGDQIQSCQWQETSETLEVRRAYHVAIPIPESYEICN